MKRKWYLYSMSGKVLGRGASEIATFLMGKTKPEYDRSRDCGDFVVVVDASKMKITGNKMNAKTYTRYSGYPGGLKKELLKDVFNAHPEKVVIRAVKGMLPDNKLKNNLLKRLYVYPNAEHPYSEQVSK